MNLSHNALAASLAAHLAGYSVPAMVWLDMQLGPSGTCRPDVFAIDKTYTALRTRAFEVKVTRSDFLSDVSSGKYLKYARYAGSTTFATPAGLVTKDEVPKGCGLITRSEEGVWRYQRKPTMSAVADLPRDTWLKLVIDGVYREFSEEARTKVQIRQHNDWAHHARARELAGREIAEAIKNRDRALAMLTAARTEIDGRTARARNHQLDAARKEIEQAEKLRTEVATTLGLPADTSWWEVREAMKEQLKGDPSNRVTTALSILKHTRNGIEEQITRLSAYPVTP